MAELTINDIKTVRFIQNRHSGKFSLRVAKENLSEIRFGFVAWSKKPNWIPHKLFFAPLAWVEEKVLRNEGVCYGAASWKNASGFIFSRMNPMVRFMWALRVTLRAVHMNIGKGLFPDIQKNTVLKCSYGTRNFQLHLKPSRMKKESKNGSAFGRLSWLKKSTPDGMIYTVPLTNKERRHSAKLSLRHRRKKVYAESDLVLGGKKPNRIPDRPFGASGMTVLYTREISCLN
jgi:hypothetical protein